MYAAGGTAEDIRRYYLAEMRLSGWSPIAAPPAPPGLPASVMFFSKGGQEASVVLAEIPQSAASMDFLISSSACLTSVSRSRSISGGPA